LISYFVSYQAYSSAFPTPPPERGTATIHRGKPIDEIHEIAEITEDIRKKIGASRVVVMDWRRAK